MVQTLPIFSKVDTQIHNPRIVLRQDTDSQLKLKFIDIDPFYFSVPSRLSWMPQTRVGNYRNNVSQDDKHNVSSTEYHRTGLNQRQIPCLHGIDH
ncbi:MAG: hypothetical protein ACI9LO_002952 [Planctomycetota bacterium]|jgi:hypothetical protein